MEGTLISRNTFNRSYQRCVSVEGTSNVTISHNVGYKAFGHCMFIGYLSQNNLFIGNLVSENKKLYQNNLPDHDHHPMAFTVNYQPNHFHDNIAVAGQR